MCGISLAVRKDNQPVEERFILEMNRKIAHRGPDDEGFYHGRNFAIGHRRLAIIDLTSLGHQPMNREDLWIIYNGEIYNYIELREELISMGHSFSSSSDTEVILSAYKEWGVESFKRLNGMWAFIIFDKTKNELVLSRDHFGIKPLYFYQNKKWFLAGSEIKQFIDFENFTPKLNQEVAINFLVDGWLNYSGKTFFEGVNEILPGHYFKYNLDSHRLRIEKWYDLRSASVPVNDGYEQAVARVREIFTNSVRIRMRSDVKVGSCLSGGIDSSSIVTSIHHNQLANADFVTVTSDFEDESFSERQYSDAIGRETGIPNVKVFSRLQDLLDRDYFDKMIYHQDQPLYSGSCFSEFSVFRAAKESGLIVMLDGQGADEYICGYEEFYLTYLWELFRSFKWRTALNVAAGKAKQRRLTQFRELGYFYRWAFLHPLKRRVKKIIGWRDHDWLSEKYWQIYREVRLSFKQKSIRDLSINQLQQSSVPYQLHSEDRNSMMFSIESRLPFLDPRLVEYVIGLPSSYKIRNGFTKAVLRDALPELPEEIKGRKTKMGFASNDPVWMLENRQMVRQELARLVESCDFFTPRLVERFDAFCNGTGPFDMIYFRVLSFGRFCQIFNIC